MYRTRGYSKRAIGRALDINRKTVAKVIQEYESSLLSSDPEGSLDTLLTRKPVYDSSSRGRKVITGALQDLIDACLRDNARKRATGLKKQCMVGIDIYEFVLSKGFKVSYSGVCKYIKEVKNADKPSSKEAFIRGYYHPGESCEFDWGEVKLYIRGKLQRFYMAVFTFSHSNGRYAWLFRHQNTLAFMESHRNFFREVGGAPSMMVYDNMRVAIKAFVGAEKKPTEALLRLSNFYRCHYRFCNARAGWEKGHVERSVEYVRRKAFSILLRFDSLEEAQNQLPTTCSRINTEEGSSSTVGKQAKLEAELAALQPCYKEMGCFELETYKVDKWSTICMKASHYSVPDTLVGKLVDVKIYSEKLVMLLQNQKVAVHERIYHPAGWSVKLEHYLNTLLRKPGAVKGSLALQKMPEGIQKLFERQFSDNSKDFVLLLQYAQEEGFTDLDILAAYQDLRDRGLRKISADQIKVMMHALTEPQEDLDTLLHPKVNKEQSADIEDGSLQILSKKERIGAYAKELKISVIKDEIEDFITLGTEQNWSYRTLLCQLLSKEVDLRTENRRKQRIRIAGFPELKYIQELVREELPKEGQLALPDLETLDFIREGRNIVFCGNPGTGKTHLSIALGIKACLEGYAVFFTSVPHLLTQIRECRSQKSLRQLEIRFQRYDMVICDEFGYVSCDKEGGELLFNHLSLRAGKKATIITTNLAFDRWGEIVKDKVLVAAMVDRLTHKAHLVSMNGQSYRVKETEKMLAREQSI